MGSIKQSACPHIVILGAGFGGLVLAKKLKNLPVKVTVIDKENHHLFQPLLYQVATAGLSPAEIAMPIRKLLRGHSNTNVILDEVVDVDQDQQEVVLKTRKIPYDFLVIATGATHSYFGHDEWAKYAPGLKAIEDATMIRRNILFSFEKAEMEDDPVKQKEWMTFVIVGGGPTGVELAGAIAELACRVIYKDFHNINSRDARIVLVEALPRILTTYPEDLSAKAQKDLETLGVEVLVNSPVQQVNKDCVELKDQVIKAHTIIWAAGVQATPVGKWLDIETDKVGRVKVDSYCRVPQYENIFVIGDAALFLENDKPLPGVAPVAKQQGEYLAEYFEKIFENKKEEIQPFHYVDKGSLATIGRSKAIVHIGKIKSSGFLAWITWWLVHILYLTGFKNKTFVFLQWIWSYLSFNRGARLITHEEKE